MPYRAVLILVLLCAALRPAAAQEYRRESLWIPYSATGPRGLEAVLVRPADGRRYPLALMSHGSPRDPESRVKMTPGRYQTQAIEFARRGFAVLIVMRRAYGLSDGAYAEGSPRCGPADYLRSANESARDLRAAVEAMRSRIDITTQGMIAVGQSAGGLASIAFAAEKPAGLAGVINFAGGRGSRGDNNVCGEDALVEAFGTLGRTARVPMLWVYAENDLYFRPELARRFHDAFQAAGGQAKLVVPPTFGRDGHSLFSASGTPIWLPMIEAFLRDENLGLRHPLPPPTADALPPPAQFSERGRTAFRQYVLAGEHKAFALSKSGRYSWRAGLRTEREARVAALESCEQSGDSCTIYAVDDDLDTDRPGAPAAATPAVPAR
jgi:dienelactone hydrolase